MDKNNEIREKVIEASLNVAAARMYADRVPEDPHAADHLDLDNEILDQALAEYARKRVV